jgi:hypothetical protein
MEKGMAASPSLREFPVINRLIERMKRLSRRAGETSELRRMDDRQLDRIAHETGLSRAALFTLCADSPGELLQQRLAEFAIPEDLLAMRHPAVLRDLQRVCGTCTTKARCASDFAACRASGRDAYCPNTCTLYALKREGLGRGAGSAQK